MAIFRLQSNVPEIYINESRDFQLLCRLYDCVLGGVKLDIDTLENIIDTRSSNSILLQLLRSKIGYFTANNITSDELRIVLDAFPTIIKNKGSLLGIKQAVNTFLKVKHLKGGAYINIVNASNSDDENPYTINIGLESSVIDTSILDSIFYYILPTGYDVFYYFYLISSPDGKLDFVDSQYKLVFSNDQIANSVEAPPLKKRIANFPELIVGSDVTFEDGETDKLENCVGIIFISSSDNSSRYLDKRDDGTLLWKDVSDPENYREVSLLGVSKSSPFHPLTDVSNPDIYTTADPSAWDGNYSTSNSVCGYYYDKKFYSDSAHKNQIKPLGQSNKLFYYDISHKNYYVYTSSFTGKEEFILIVHQEDIG